MNEFEIDNILSTGAILAGGSIRDMLNNNKPKDYDFFFCSIESLDLARVELFGKGELTKRTEYTETFLYQGKTVQLVFKKIYTSPDEVINDFDFNICRAYKTSARTFYSVEMMSDIEKKKITVNVITKPISSLQRLGKYLKEGFDINNSYHYILDVMKDKSPSVVLNSSFYE